MSKVQSTVVTDSSVIEKITSHVVKEFKSLKDKALIIKEDNGVFYVYKHKDGSPIILGQGVLG